MTGYNTASAPSSMSRALATMDAAGASFFLHDANKNVMQRTDADGDLLEEYEYAPFRREHGGNQSKRRLLLRGIRRHDRPRLLQLQVLCAGARKMDSVGSQL